MKTSLKKKKNAATTELQAVPVSQNREYRGLFSRLRGPRDLSLLFIVPEGSTLEETLELLRFAASLRGKAEHRRHALVPHPLDSVFRSCEVFGSVQGFDPGENMGALVKHAVKNLRADLMFASREMKVRGLSVHTIRNRINRYRNPSMWSNISEGILDRLPVVQKTRMRSLEKELENARLYVTRHTLRFRGALKRILNSVEARSVPVWLPISLDPFTGSAWPFSSYMRLSRLLAQNGVRFVVTIDERYARVRSGKDKETLAGLPSFRKEIALLSRKHGCIELIENPSIADLCSLAAGAGIAIGNPSAELLLSQIHGGRILFLHDMLTYRSAGARTAEDVSAHPSHGRSLFSDALQIGGGTGLHPRVDDCARDCPACANNYCVDTISPEAVWEEVRTLARLVSQ